MSKKLLGQFYTKNNPFDNTLFYKWLEIANFKNEIILEPFAGSNNIVKMLYDLGYKNKWICYDIEPSKINNFPNFIINQRNTILDYPKNFKIAITNPPYLAKNSATRNNLPFINTKYDDLYKVALDIMLKNNDFVAAIIPESFITQGIFHNRLYGIISLTYKLFEDTVCPVCLALFIPKNKKLNIIDDFIIYRENNFIVNFKNINRLKSKNKYDWKFNDPYGEIGLFCIDNTKTKSIRFVLGNIIASNKITHSNRGVTRIKGIPNNVNIDLFINKLNEELNKFRDNTFDITLTAFKQLRKDGLYRRRLDFKSAKEILNYCLDNYNNFKI